ncbi:MAG: 6,7-dimethyl-8-ribityllumazine synthase, partial [Mangrovimonas sp.]|nr:6,7-dimethyl-8-ribityllumazine synthase [Mangrovimonas sp.]
MATENKNLSHYDKATIPNAKDFRFGIVVSQWNDSITKALEKGAYETLVEQGVSKDNILTYEVPGSFELIYGSKKMQAQGVDAVIAIGSVIQGETKHFDFV